VSGCEIIEYGGGFIHERKTQVILIIIFIIAIIMGYLLMGILIIFPIIMITMLTYATIKCSE
jgi:hypothetical protein